MNNARILVVEDERIIALDLGQRLRKLDYEVAGVAANAQQALTLALSERPDLVLMDIHIEGQPDGIEAARLIHEQTHIPIIFLTAYADSATLKRAQATLPFGYLIKPCQTSELNAAILMALARRAAEAKLEHSEERQRLALDAAELGAWEWEVGSDHMNTDGHFNTILGSAIAGLPAETFTTSWSEFLARIHPDDRDTLQSALERAREDRQPISLNLRLIHEDGSVTWVETHARVYASAAAPERVIGVLKDITARRQIEAKLRLASAVFESAAEGIFFMDEARNIVSINPAFSTITGYAEEEASGQDAETLLHARRHSDGFYPRLREIPGGQWQGETAYRRRNGEVFPVWENVSLVQDTDSAQIHYISVFTDITALQRAETELHHLAHFDTLTGLPNRLLFHDLLEHALMRAQRQATRCAVLLFDLDGFKSINDTLGHASGDLLLQTVALRLKQNLRGDDTVARLGGDEFVILLDGVAQPEDVAHIAKKHLAVLRQPVELAGERVAVSASVGLSLYPDDGINAASLIKAADTAMFQAKTEGRNRFCFYTQDMAARVADRMNLEQGLRRALDNGAELMLHYQPQVRLADGSLCGVEALLRWRHPQQGMISPDRFIHIAEATGLIEPLGRWVLQTACLDAATWCRAGWTGRLAVNVSGRQLASVNLVAEVRAALADSGLPARQLEIEITESTLLVIEHDHRLLDQIKALGAQIAIDDFGTGYSSLSVLRHLPIDRLKIDQSFVRNLPANGDDMAIATTINALARTLGLATIAEGVETAAQLAALVGLGCDEAQGYLFSHAVPAEQIAALLQGAPPWNALFPADARDKNPAAA